MWFRRLASSMLGLLAAVALAELVLRALAPQPKSWLEIYRVLPEPLYYGLALNAHSFVDTQETRWSTFTDGVGHRVANPEARTPDRQQVLVLGDSFTFGMGVEYEQTFVGMLNALPDVPAWFINAGVGGYGPVQYRVVLDQLLTEGMQPSAVIVVSYLGNDFQDCVWGKAARVENGALGDTGGLRSVLKRNLHSYRLASKAWHAWNPTPETLQFQQAFVPGSWSEPFFVRARSQYREEFERMSAACRSRSIPFLVVLIPPCQAVDAARQAEGSLRFDLPTTMALETLRELEIACVDASPGLAEIGASRAYFAIDGHLTPSGNQVVRDAILRGARQFLGWP